MFGSVAAAMVLAASVSQVAAGPFNHAHSRIARGYKQDAEILEDYTPYHVRYIALGCTGKHGQPFFEECCHPLLRWQNLSDRPAQCIPSAAASSSAVIAEPTASPIDVDPIYTDDEDCEDETSTYVAPAAKTPEPTYVAPTSSKMVTSTYKADPTTYVPEPTTSKSTSKAPEPTKAPSTDGDITGGFATFYTQNGNPGACGEYHQDSDLIVAIDSRRYGALEKKSDLCDKAILITNTKNGKSVQVNVKDACPTCTNENSIDMSTGAFNQIATPEEGMVPISWHFL